MALVVTNLNAHLIIIFAHISQQNIFLILLAHFEINIWIYWTWY